MHLFSHGPVVGTGIGGLRKQVITQKDQRKYQQWNREKQCRKITHLMGQSMLNEHVAQWLG